MPSPLRFTCCPTTKLDPFRFLVPPSVRLLLYLFVYLFFIILFIFSFLHFNFNFLTKSKKKTSGWRTAWRTTKHRYGSRCARHELLSIAEHMCVRQIRHMSVRWANDAAQLRLPWSTPGAITSSMPGARVPCCCCCRVVLSRDSSLPDFEVADPAFSSTRAQTN